VPSRDSRPPRSPFRSALHRPCAATTASADSSPRRLQQRRPFRYEARPPQIRAFTFPAQPPDLRRLPLVTGASRSLARSPRETSPPIRFLFVGSRVSLHASFRRSLALPPLLFARVGVTSFPRVLPPLAVAHAGHTKRKPPGLGPGASNPTRSRQLSAARPPGTERTGR
jgi:hypothetical protein